MMCGQIKRIRPGIVSIGFILTLICSSYSAAGTATDTTAINKNVKSLTTKLSSPSAIALDRRGNLYVTDLEKGHVEMIMPDGIKTVLAKGLNTPTDLAVDPKGRVYVCEASVGKIRCIHPDGTITLVAEGLNTPSGIVLDRDGGLYVTCAGDGTIIKIPPGL